MEEEPDVLQVVPQNVATLFLQSLSFEQAVPLVQMVASAKAHGTAIARRRR
jgi:hypothetical protein